jgi:sarcosine oxidase subunit gamma
VTVDRSPLVGFAQRFAQASSEDFAVVEQPFWHQLNLRVAPAESAAAAVVLGAELPTEPNTVVECAFGSILWLGPDEWLLLSPRELATTEAALRAALVDLAHSLVDVSAARTVISLTGTSVRGVLAHGCALDLDAVALRPGRCAQTKVALTNVVLVVPADQPGEFATSMRLLILVRASFAPYLASWLLDAATETLVRR